jgi:hypothetical protein
MPMNSPAQSALENFERLRFQFGSAVAADPIISAAFVAASNAINAKAASLRAQIAAAAEQRQPKANTEADANTDANADADEPDNIDSEGAPS